MQCTQRCSILYPAGDEGHYGDTPSLLYLCFFLPFYPPTLSLLSLSLSMHPLALSLTSYPSFPRPKVTPPYTHDRSLALSLSGVQDGCVQPILLAAADDPIGHIDQTLSAVVVSITRRSRPPGAQLWWLGVG